MKIQKSATYVDAFVLVVPKKKVAAYRRMAQKGGKIWMKYGALDYKECVGEDLHPKMGGYPVLTFPRMVKLKRGETVWFSYITYRSKQHRDQVNAKVMQDPSMQPDDPEHMKKMPFDMKRMAYGGFKVSVSA